MKAIELKKKISENGYRSIFATLYGEENLEVAKARYIKAVDEFEKDEVVKSALGEHVACKYVQNKKGELEEYCKNVTDWEIKKYLNIY